MIKGLRPYRSDARAQPGDENAQSSAESEKIADTIGSGMPIDRPMAGNTEIRPVLPIAVAIETPKMIANERRGMAVISRGGADMALP